MQNGTTLNLCNLGKENFNKQKTEFWERCKNVQQKKHL